MEQSNTVSLNNVLLMKAQEELNHYGIDVNIALTPYYVMMRRLLFIFFMLGSVLGFADFIIPQNDPVYDFLEMSSTLKMSELRHFQYPLYYHDVIKNLEGIAENNDSPAFQRVTAYHLRRLKADYPAGTHIAVYPPQKIIDSIKGLMTTDPAHKRLFTTTGPSNADNQSFLYASGILGFHYDTKSSRQNVNRNKKYYGVESAGNFTENFGYYFVFRKGHYQGNAAFIVENPFLARYWGAPFEDDGTYYETDMTIEVDFKNPYLDLSMGYGSFDIGRTISSSIILNSHVKPYGYFKFHKSWGMLEYNGINAQLIPDKITEDMKTYYSKSMAIQTLALYGKNASFGLGNSTIYGDRTIDIGYSTPLAIYMIMDNNLHGRDNVLFFGFGEYRMIPGVALYANFLFDDLANDRWKTAEWLSYSAYQLGVMNQFKSIPIELATEATIVGPSTYGHRSVEMDDRASLTYMHSDRLLGPLHGANFLSLVGRLRFHAPRFDLSFIYDNVQQGSTGSHPDFRAHNEKFLAGDFSRKEIFTTDLNLRIISELHIFGKHEYHTSKKENLHYIFTGIEFRY